MLLKAAGATEDVPGRPELAREVHAELRLEGPRGSVIHDCCGGGSEIVLLKRKPHTWREIHDCGGEIVLFSGSHTWRGSDNFFTAEARKTDAVDYTRGSMAPTIHDHRAKKGPPRGVSIRPSRFCHNFVPGEMLLVPVELLCEWSQAGLPGVCRSFLVFLVC